MRSFIVIFSFFLLITGIPASSYAQNEPSAQTQAPQQERLRYRNTLDYFADDGKMDKEEMQEEATYVFQRCSEHVFHNRHYDCACLAGAFYQKREKLGGMIPQEVIVGDLYKTSKQCVNTAAIAGTSYERCMSMQNDFSDLNIGADAYEEYCECVGKMVARSFAESPTTRLRHMRIFYVESSKHCMRETMRGG